ncbi:uncharacterized protein PGTG_19108 [Puccinia graminis f. sp. tritici CRL 75-36-700-3]|uniref:RRM domain-containing protein n=1 Tax=Puccinia graminis f. sp. tritici (strain CRL 75-36-700-3 / race SCCL) TaxID=418459 RepID=E3L9Y9_PUCGT|nr:uncharacterized protein PGTG_19097 [Puccinia graminis f. sp. tritici CRL 75-36-700-3]XP_003337794.1 uncharacterized protein PGTG_19108 [Puccinia graminis f. sp. tritici CRL 75-36-700-3]EFP93364.1 hypothetical protein PGTG_19097 [Puccinia graminis f. sp. tritici CRL 75-36-700-3]EFP93375.1 hypothetical protein PGTG_19108 [Puccinia graminis f. sp. tritici CRL 75-36-700-3]
MHDQSSHCYPSPVRYFHAPLPWPIELANLSPGTTTEDLWTILATYGEIDHCFLLPRKQLNPGTIIHFSDYKTAAAAAEDLDGTFHPLLSSSFPTPPRYKFGGGYK